MTERQEVDETNGLSSTTIRCNKKNLSSNSSSSKTTDCNRISRGSVSIRTRKPHLERIGT